MVIVDSTIWIDYFRGVRCAETDYLDRELGRQPFGLIDLILCEVLQGVRDDASFANVLSELIKFEIFETGGRSLAIQAARNFRTLREQGHTVRRTIDCLIATFCIENGHSLLHHDRDFDLFELVFGLPVIHA
ncbi:MAG TPA: PIN domain nuclease [Candidatus Dormibacteraeota bacterium]|nr:PIN domain nuclease [Candidatus Dormibacteraeota bacterium]